MADIAQDNQNQNLNSQEGMTKKERRELRRQEKQANRDKSVRGRTTKKIIFWLAVLVVIGGGLWAVYEYAGQTPSTESGADLSLPFSKEEWIKGSADAKINLVEYSDFQCPACSAYHPMLEQLSSDFGDRLAFVYRHFPLKRIHPNAEMAARAAEAAGKQGKFWEMHDMIFDNQSNWSGMPSAKSAFVGYAESLGLDKKKFEDDIDSGEVKKSVDDDLASGEDSSVSATPSFYLNGKKITNPQSLDEFRQLITDALIKTGENTDLEQD